MLPVNANPSTFPSLRVGVGTALFIAALPAVCPVGRRYLKRWKRKPSTSLLPVELPYFAPDIPRRLPTNTEIEHATILVKHNGYKVV